MTHLKIKGRPDLVRDPVSKAILVRPNTEYEAYRKRREREAAKETEIDDLRSEVAELRNLVKKLLEDRGG